MAKAKNRKRVSADQIMKKRQNQNIIKKTLNPFEVHINKEKMRVLGQKQKNERGLPGVSRAKAIQKRKHTLLNEYKLQHKSNKFIDKRIREKSLMSEEDTAIARFAAVRAKAHNKKNMDDPEDEFHLTHKNQTLAEIEKFDFDDLHSDDEESMDENKPGRLDSSFVGDAHFGGDLFKNSGREGAKTHKQLIEQLIEESKKRKAEKQKIKEATVQLTEKLDSEWKDLVQLVSKNAKKEESKDLEKSKLDDYDKVMRELRFEARGTVSDRLKTEDEIAKEEKDKLEKLEAERLERMTDFDASDVIKPKHRSADDLDDNFVIESDIEENMLSYDHEGKSNVQVQAELDGKIVGDPEEQHNSENYSDNEDVGEEETGESDSEDSLADLKENKESDEESETETQESVNENKQIKIGTKRNIQDTGNEGKMIKLDSIESALGNKFDKNRKKVLEKTDDELSEAEKKELEKAGNELPFTFSLPDSYENFTETLTGHSINHQKVILERMIKCNHPSLSQGNKEGLGLLFQYLLQYLNDLFSDIENLTNLQKSFQAFKALMPHIYDLAHLNKETAHNSVRAVMKEKHEDFRKKRKKYPSLEVLAFLKLISLLFPTSDFRNQVVTPCFIFIEQMLRSCAVRNVRDISYGMFLCTLVLEYTSLSKRYLPAPMDFIAGILHMAIPKTSVRIIKVLPPFRSLSSDLVLTTDCSSMNVNKKLHVFCLVETEITDQFKVAVLYVALRLLNEFMDNFKNLSSNIEIFEVVEKYLHQIPMEFYPQEVKIEHKEICDTLVKLESDRKLQFLIMEEQKPKALRLYEPKIVEVYDFKRHKVQSKEKAEKAKLIHKLKKETKGALREIRRDTAFLGRLQIKQKIQSDKERKARVNRIYAEAATQQSELNALDRKKKRDK